MDRGAQIDEVEGVRVASASSIVIDFRYRGVRCPERVRLRPTKANYQQCVRWREAILHEIVTGQFDYRRHFPESRRANQFDAPGSQVNVKEFLDGWLSREQTRVRQSTLPRLPQDRQPADRQLWGPETGQPQAQAYRRVA